MPVIATVTFPPRGSVGDLPPADVIFGRSPAMQSVRRTVGKVAGTDVPLLIHGENGTGKEVLAKYIYQLPSKNGGLFVKVNCAAIPGTLLESELFGYQKGAFTGAVSSKPGRVELAHGGTLFLDEIAELDPALQAKLLQVLQDGQFCRIGDQEDKRVEARVICATNCKLEQRIEEGAFRQDLYYRINVISIHMPSLRERREDIPILAEYFLTDFNRRFQRSAPPFPKNTMRLLQQKEWPGNVRELENWVARYVLLGSEEVLGTESFVKRSVAVPVETSEDSSIPLKRIAKQVTREMERNLILRVLQDNHWNRRKTAEVLKISYRGLLNKIRQAGLAPERPRSRSRSAGKPPSSEDSCPRAPSHALEKPPV